MIKKTLLTFSIVLFISIFVSSAYANHSWGSYHWARTANPLNLRLGDNVSSSWDAFLSIASTDWSVSSVLNTTVVAGQANPKNCRPTAGRVEVCNNRYGNNGWLGIAQIWVSGSHITKGVTKLNDTYFNTPTYNTPAWKQFVVCQEIGHTFGLDHQDENFNNENLGTCMDYTNDPSGTLGTNGTLNNLHPNSHDYAQLETIYTHLDSTNSWGGSIANGHANSSVDLNDPSAWGRAIRQASDKRTSVFERDLGNGNKLFTFVIWAQ